MDSTLAYIAVGLLVSLTIFVLFLGLRRVLVGGSEIDERLSMYAATSELYLGATEERPGVSQRVDNFVGTRGFAGPIAQRLRRAGLKLTVTEFLLLKLGAALLPFAILLIVQRQPLAGVLVGGVCFMLPDIWVRQLQRRRSAQFILQLPETLTLIVSGLRAGFSLPQSLQNISKQAPEPTASEFKRVSQELQLGVPYLDALDTLARHIESEDLEMIISVLKINARVGGNLAQVLETVSTTIRERVRLRRQIQVMTSMPRASSYVLGLLPIGFTLVLMVLNPGYIMYVFQWNIFLCIPVGAFAMTVTGFLVIRKMTQIDV